MKNRETIFETNKGYFDISLNLFAENLNITVLDISLVSRTIYLSPIDPEGKTIDTIVANIVLCHKPSGLISRLELLSRYGTEHLLSESIPDICSDLAVRFSLLSEENGFFSPTWLFVTTEGKEFKPTGKRVDWYKEAKNNFICRKYIIPNRTSYTNNRDTDMFWLWFCSGITSYDYSLYNDFSIHY